MNIITEIDGSHVERKWHTEASLYSSLTNALVVPDLMPGQTFGAIELSARSIDRDSDAHLEYIQSEYDPSVLTSLRLLYQRRNRIRQQLARLAERVSVKHYHDLVGVNTLGYRVIKVVKGWKEVSAYEWSIEHGLWKTVQDEERITRTEFYERLLKYGQLSPRAKQSAYQSLRQSRLADEIAKRLNTDIPKNYVWRTNPRTIRVRINPMEDRFGNSIPHNANLHQILMRPEPIYGSKKVPNIDWQQVRLEWMRRLELIQPLQEALNKELMEIEDQMIDLRPSSTHRFNRCVQLSAELFPASSRNTHLLAIGSTGLFPSLDLEDADGGVLPGDPTSMLARNQGLVAYLCPDTVTGIDELVASLRDVEQQCLNYDRTGELPRVPQHWLEVGNPASYLGSNQAVDLNARRGHIVVTRRPGFDPNVHHSLASRLTSDAEGSPICIDDREGRADILDERVQTCLNALLAGRASGSEDQTFNLTRSVGELKDLPQTGSQSSDFLRWLLTTGKEQKLYAFKVKGHATPIYAPLRDYMEKTKTLHGVKIASFHAVTRKPSIAMLASAYLGWKFAIAPTIADANRLGRESFNDLVASRRFITRLFRKLRNRSRYLVLRRGFLIGEPVKRDKPIAITRPDTLGHYDIPFRDGIAFSREQVIAIMNSDAAPFSAAEVPDKTGNSTITVPYVVTQKGIRYYLWFTTDGRRLTDDERRRCSIDSFKRATKVLPPELFANPFLYKSWLQGCVFARYGRNAFRSLAEDSALASKLDRLKVVKTAWDLSPLSFILEWFTNLGDIIQNAQDILSTDTVGIMPIGGPWCRVTERFAISRLSAPQRYHLVQRLLGAEYYPTFWVASPPGERHFWGASVEMVPSRLEWEWAVKDNLTGRFVSRTEWLNELLPRLSRSRAAVTNRVPLQWERELPEFRPSLRIDTGKGLTLLAMWLSGLRR